MITPDIATFGKDPGDGAPVSAVAGPAGAAAKPVHRAFEFGLVVYDAAMTTTSRDQGAAPEAGSLLDIERELGAHNYKPLDVIVTRGEGVWLWDVDGRRYLDCLSAYSAVNQGHCHPKIRDALIEQAGRLALTSRAFRNDQLPLF